MMRDADWGSGARSVRSNCSNRLNDQPTALPAALTRRRWNQIRAPAGALKSYCNSLAIMQRLVQSDPGNAGWQRDLSVSYGKLGDVFSEQGDIEEAIKNYRLALALVDRLISV
jgi:tetratricopeptide (TPR) repeat protein